VLGRLREAGCEEVFVRECAESASVLFIDVDITCCLQVMRLPDVALDAAPARDGAAMRMRTRTNTVIAVLVKYRAQGPQHP